MKNKISFLSRFKQWILSIVSCRFIIVCKLTGKCYYKYTVGGDKVFTGDIKLAKKFKYRITAYVYLLYLGFDNDVVKICN